jgi:hypothetical protein
MQRTSALLLAIALAACGKDYNGACEHYQTLRDRNVAVFNGNVDARYQTHDTPARRTAQIEHCVAEMKELRVDPSCVLAATAADKAYDCFDAARPKSVR